MMSFRSQKHSGIVVQGEPLNSLRQLPEQSVHLVITAPPLELREGLSQGRRASYKNYLLFMKQIWKQTKRVLIDGGRLCVCTGEMQYNGHPQPTFAHFIDQLIHLGFLYRGTIIWEGRPQQRRRSTSNDWRYYNAPTIDLEHRSVIAFSKTRFKLEGDRERSDITADEFMAATRSVWQFNWAGISRADSASPFPQDLPNKLIKFYTYQDNVVLSMFSGNVEVGLAATSLKRRFILLNMSPEDSSNAQLKLREAGIETESWDISDEASDA